MYKIYFYLEITKHFILHSANISFGVDSRHDMLLQGTVEVIGKHLYNEDTTRTPIQHGALDRRMVHDT